jgi:hypothetical protein
LTVNSDSKRNRWGKHEKDMHYPDEDDEFYDDNEDEWAVASVKWELHQQEWVNAFYSNLLLYASTVVWAMRSLRL